MIRKQIFDRVRSMLGRSFAAAEITELDQMIDCAEGDEAACDRNGNALDQPRAIGPQGIALIKQFEGCARTRKDGMVEAYPDPGTGGDPWTIGWGATGKTIARSTVWTQAECDERLEADLKRYSAEVIFALEDAPTSQRQFDALVSFHYNTGAIRKATLTRLHKAGEVAAAAREFDRWVNAGGRIMPGLVRRRAAEAALYGR